jgi:Uma2 family endonuclease
MRSNPQRVSSLDYTYISPEDYLEGEKSSPIKHEYIRGLVYAIVGASKAHGIVAGNLFSLLRSHLRGKDCTLINPTYLELEFASSSKDVLWVRMA